MVYDFRQFLGVSLAPLLLISFCLCPYAIQTENFNFQASPPRSTQLTSLTLINTDSDQPIWYNDPLAHGDTLNLTTLPSRALNIQANTSPAVVASVRFLLDHGEIDSTDNTPPYALAGDNQGDYFPWTPSVGWHTLTATPYSQPDARGIAGTALTVTFQVIDQPRPACTHSLAKLIAQAQPGDTLHVPACIYREQVTVDKPLSLIADPGAEIRGSEVWTGWTRVGNTWLSTLQLPKFSAHGKCHPGTERCLWPEQAFLDGRPLFQVATDPAPGQFAQDPARHVVLADDPIGHTVEVTTRTSWIQAEADSVRLQGFRLRHAANDSQTGALNVDGHDRWLIQNNVLSDVHGAVLSFSNASQQQVLDNDIFRGGQLGVHGTEGAENRVQGNWIHDNNTEDFDPDWEASGLKIVLNQNLSLAANEVYNNAGPGLWCDIDCQTITVRGNRVHHNQRAGIHFEISDGAEISGNAVWENGWGGSDWGWGAGILISSSRHADVVGNLVAWNADGISVISQDRCSDPCNPLWNQVIGNHVQRNAIVKTDDDPCDPGHGNIYALAWLQDWGGILFDSAADNWGGQNRYEFPAPEGQVRFTWGDQDYIHLQDFNTTPGEENGRYLTAVEKERLLASAQVPEAPEDHRLRPGCRVGTFLRPGHPVTQDP